MKVHKWTAALAAAGVVSVASVAQAEERPMSQVLTPVSGTTLSGYVDTSAIWKFGTGTRVQTFSDEQGRIWRERSEDRLPGRFNDGADRVDGFNLNVVGLTLSRPLGIENWAAGYQVDLLFGPDAVAYQNSVLDLDSDFAVKQAHVDLRVPMGTGLDVKMGVFDRIIGYESFESYRNPNFSRSFGWQLEPTHHTGVLLSYQLTEAVGVSGGVANTYHPGINARSPRSESHKTYMAAIDFTAPDATGFMAGSSLSVGFVNGFSGNQKDTTSLYVGGSLLTPIEGLRIGAAFDYRWNGVGAAVLGDSDMWVPLTHGKNWAYAIAGYLSFQATEKLAFAGRADLTRGSDGTWFDAGQEGVSDRKNELFALTGTAEYALWANVVTRAELRWDRSLTGDRPYGRGDGSKNAVSLAGNVVFKF